MLSSLLTLGTGVVGLSTAIRVQETGRYNVTIVAETFPTDPRTIRYTSHWAVSVLQSISNDRVVLFSSPLQGAHHVSQAFGDARQKGTLSPCLWYPSQNLRIQHRFCGYSHQNTLHDHAALDKETFETMWKDSEPDGRGAVAGLFFRHTQTEFRADGVDPSPWLDYMPNVSSPICLHCARVAQQTTQFRVVPEHDLIPGSTAGYAFTTFTLNTPAYLNWLLARFLSGGGFMKRVSLQHISQVILVEHLSCEIPRSVRSGDLMICP